MLVERADFHIRTGAEPKLLKRAFIGANGVVHRLASE